MTRGRIGIEEFVFVDDSVIDIGALGPLASRDIGFHKRRQSSYFYGFIDFAIFVNCLAIFRWKGVWLRDSDQLLPSQWVESVLRFLVCADDFHVAGVDNRKFDMAGLGVGSSGRIAFFDGFCCLD